MKASHLALCLLATFSSVQATITEAAKPNVILIYTDDQGTIDANCYGAKDLITPTIDDLSLIHI